MSSSPSKLTIFLDSKGRWFLSTTADWQLWGIVLILALVMFLIYRKLRYQSVPTYVDCVAFVVSLAGMISALLVLIIFVLTRPPAVDMLSSQMLVLIGLVVSIVLVGSAYSKLQSLLFPPQAPKPPADLK